MENKLTTIGIDIGGTNIKYGLISPTYEIYWASNKSTKAHTAREIVVENVLDAVKECFCIARDMGLNVKSIGIGSPGLIDNLNMIIGGADNINGWNNIPLGNLIKSQVNVPVFVINDASAMAIGEYCNSCDSGESVVFITLGTGIGGAIILNGELYEGHYGMGGELGVFPMIVNGEKKNWEDVASTTAMIKLYRNKMRNKGAIDFDMNGRDIIERYKVGESMAIEVLEQISELLAMGIGGYINIFNPSKVIIGGGISESGNILMDKLRNHISGFALKECLLNVEILSANMENNAGYVGAAIFAMKVVDNNHQVIVPEHIK